MKTVKELTVKLAKASAEKALRRDAERTTCHAIYQPKVPAGIARFKKSKQ